MHVFFTARLVCLSVSQEHCSWFLSVHAFVFLFFVKKIQDENLKTYSLILVKLIRFLFYITVENWNNKKTGKIMKQIRTTTKKLSAPSLLEHSFKSTVFIHLMETTGRCTKLNLWLFQIKVVPWVRVKIKAHRLKWYFENLNSVGIMLWKTKGFTRGLRSFTKNINREFILWLGRGFFCSYIFQCFYQFFF